MRKMMRTIRWFFVNGAFAAAVYFGLHEGIEGAKNVALFWAWLNISLSFFTFSDTVVKSLRDKGVAPSVPQWVDITYDAVIATALAWYGHPVLASLWVMHILFVAAMWERVRKEGGKSA